MSKKQIDLPSSFYAARSLLAEKIGACVLVDPSCLPSRGKLPRDQIHDEHLRTLLALALVNSDPVRLARVSLKIIGRDYVCRLLELLGGWTRDKGELSLAGQAVNSPATWRRYKHVEFAWVSNVDWYVNRYVEMLETERKFVEYAEGMRAAWIGASESGRDVSNWQTGRW